MALWRAKDLQYWLYAVLATRFGSAIELRRSSVARLYEVNRHDFEAQARGGSPQTRAVFAGQVHKFLQEHLEGAGYRQGDCGLIKTIVANGSEYEALIALRGPTAEHIRADEVCVSIFMYRKRR